MVYSRDTALIMETMRERLTTDVDTLFLVREKATRRCIRLMDSGRSKRSVSQAS